MMTGLQSRMIAARYPDTSPPTILGSTTDGFAQRHT